MIGKNPSKIYLTGLLLFFMVFFQNNSFVLGKEIKTVSGVTDQSLELTPKETEWIKNRKKPIRVGVDSFWEPIEFKDKKKQLTGISVNYLKKIETMLGIRFELVTGESWSQLLEMSKSKEVDMFSSIVHTKRRKEFLSFTEPYLSFPVVIFTREDISFVSDIREFNDKPIAVLKDHAIYDYILRDFPDMNLMPVPNIPQGLKALENKSAAAFIENLLPTSFFIKRYGYTNLQVAGETPYKYNLSMGVRKDWPELLGAVQKALNHISPEERDEIYHNWVRLEWEHSFDYSTLWRYLIAATVCFLCIWIVTLLRYFRIQKQAEEALRKSEGQYRVLVESATDAILRVDVNGIIVDWNPAAQNIFGYRPDEIIGQDVLLLVPDHEHETHMKYFHHMLVEGESLTNIEGVRKKKDGTLIPLEFSTGIIKDDTGNLVGISVIARDITEKKRQEKEADIQREQLLQADKLATLGTLVAGVAHEINNPNNFISLNISSLHDFCKSISPILDDYYASNGEFQIGGMPYSLARKRIPEAIRDIQDGSNRIARIVNSLKKYASRPLGEFEEEVDINHVVKESVKLLQGTIKKSTHQFKSTYRDNLPLIKGNFQRLEQVIVNIIQNACHSLTDKKKGIEIRTGFQEETHQLFIEVIDEGRGIPSSDIVHIFDPFFTTKREFGGTGLGLSIALGIIKDHKGTIHFESEVDKGTRVAIKLPASES